MRILCVLQNAWGDRDLPIIFKPNPLNKSAKVIKKMVGNHEFRFCNTTDEMTKTAKGKPKPNLEHFRKIIPYMYTYDLILVCGNQAKETVKLFETEITTGKDKLLPIMYIPHPASRSLSNIQIEEIKNKIETLLD